MNTGGVICFHEESDFLCARCGADPAPASAFASESTNVWEAVGSPSAKQESSNVWASVGSSPKKDEPSNVWAAHDPDAEPEISFDTGASESTSPTLPSIDWTIGEDDGTPTRSRPTRPTSAR